jgi:hypothetical protein
MMNNVIDFNGNGGANLALRNRGYNGADFAIQPLPLYVYPSGDVREPVKIKNKYASVRADDHTILGIHSINYKAVEHKDMIDTQRDVIIRSGLADDSIIETISLDATGKKCYVKHELPNHKIDTPKGDSASLTFLSINSFCGTWAYQISAGANQGACQNSQVFTAGAATLYKARHNRHLDIQHAADVIVNAVPLFTEQAELWHKWNDTVCTDVRAAYIFAKLINPEFYSLIKEYYSKSFSPVFTKEIRRNRNFMYLWNQWHTHYKSALGGNLWGVYNTMTDWGTHIQSKSVNVAGIQHRRSVVIQKVLETPYFIAA